MMDLVLFYFILFLGFTFFSLIIDLDKGCDVTLCMMDKGSGTDNVVQYDNSIFVRIKNDGLSLYFTFSSFILLFF